MKRDIERLPVLKDGPHPDEADLLVEMFDWKIASSPQTIGTLALGPCIGIVIYSPGEQVGFVGHFVAPHASKLDAQAMVDNALSVAKPYELLAWVRGGSIDPEDQEDNEFIQTARNFTEELLTRSGIINSDVSWTENDRLVVDLILDCKTGEFRSSTWSIDEDPSS